MTNSGQRVVAYEPPRAERDGLSTSELLSRLSNELTRLVRDEVQLLRLDAMRAGKRAGMGFGAFGAAGVLGWFATACLLAAAILGLATVLPAWAAAVIVGAAVLVAAGIAALVGRTMLRRSKQIGVPDEITDNIRADVATLKEHAKR